MYIYTVHEFSGMFNEPIALFYLQTSGLLGTLHEDKPLDAQSIVAKTDVISAMEAIEG